MKEAVTVVKVGGAVIENSDSLRVFLSNFSKINGNKLLVHGGGRSATRIAKKLGIESCMVEGRRITDANMLNVVTMVYGGLVNKTIVSHLQAMKINALGMTGADMNVILSRRRPIKNGIDFGFVGDVIGVSCDVLSSLFSLKVTPIIAPLTHDGEGIILNTNADSIASEIAKALVEAYDVTLIYCFEKAGVLKNIDDPSSVIPSITKESYPLLLKSGVIDGGMKPKIETALMAIGAKVKKVIITSALSSDFNSGTVIS